MFLFQSGSQQAAAVERRRRNDEERKQRIFNPRQRLIGIDKHALDRQVLERRLAKEEECRINAVFDQQLLRNDTIALRFEQELEKEKRQKNKQLIEYRLHYQTPQSRREFDLNDPNVLKKSLPPRVGDDDPRCCASSAQKFQGEDLANKDRLKAQKEQTRAWLEQQMLEKRLVEDERKHTEKAHGEVMIAIDKRACEIDRMEQESRRNLDATLLGYNKSLAQEKSLQQFREKSKTEVEKRTEIYNSMMSDLLCENKGVHVSNLGPNRVLGSMYKGMSPDEQAAVREEQLRQIEAKQRQKRIDAELEEQRTNLTEHIAEKIFSREKDIIKASRDLRMKVSEENQRLAQEQKAQQCYLNKYVYIAQPTEEFYSQFNKDVR